MASDSVIAKIIRTVIFSVFITGLVLFLIPVYVYRFALSLLYSKRPGSGRGRFMAINSTKFVDADGSLPPLQNVILKLKMQGQLDMAKLKKDVTEKFLGALDPDGKISYPELKQYVQMCHGFPMWMEDLNFSLENHLNFCTGSEIEEGQVDSIFKSLLLVPFQVGRSPWEAFIYYIKPDEENPEGQTLVLFKFHHCLTDGYSIFFGITKMCCELPMHKYGGRKTLVKKAGVGNAGCCYSVNLMEFVSVMKDLRTNPDKNLLQGRTPSNHKLLAKSSAEIRFQDVRAASKAQRVSCTSIIVTCIANGIRRFTNASDSSHMIMKLPFPILQRSMHLRNQLFGGPLKLPLDKEVAASMTEKRIGLTKKIAPVLHYVAQIFYALPLKLQTFFTGNGVPGVTISIFPGPTELVSTVDMNLINDIDYCLAGFSYDPFVFSVLTYNGQLCFWVSINPQYLPAGKDAQDLVREIQDEFSKLRNVDINANTNAYVDGNKDGGV